MELDRGATARNKQLGRASQQAAAGQGLDNAGFLVGLNNDNIRNNMQTRNPLLASLMRGAV